MHSFMASLKKKNYSHILFLIIFTFPIFIFGINDLEEYQLGTFTAIIYWEDFTGLLTFFYDFYGPGTKLPTGPGPIFHPLNFFLSNLKFYYVIFTIFHLFIQLEFTKRLFRLFKIEYSNYLLSILLVFCLTNIQFGISVDWISVFFTYCMFPLIFYYFIKIIEKKNKLAYYKFAFFFSLWIVNGHLAFISLYTIFLLIYFCLSIKNFDHLKAIFNFSFFISIIFLLLMVSENLFYIMRELSYFDGWRRVQGSYDFRNFIEIFYPTEHFLSSMPLNRLPGNPILIYFAIFISSIAALNFVKSLKKIPIKYFFQEASKLFFNRIHVNLNFKFCFLFFLFLIFSLWPFLSVVPAVSSIYSARDIFLYLGIFIYFINYKKLGHKTKLVLNFLLIFYSFLFFAINVHNNIKANENNFILDKYKKTDFINKLEELNLSKNDYQRIYLSPNLSPEICCGYEEDGIFAVTDLIKFNLAPLNGYFKHTSMKHFGDEQHVMNGYIDSHFKYINNEFFLNIFKINYLLIEENELVKLENKNFKLIKKIKTSENNLFLYKRNVLNYSIKKENLNSLQTNLKNCKVRTLVSGAWVNEDSKLDCLIRNKNLFDQSNHHLSRVSNGIFHIKNIKTNNYPVIPFIFDENWKSSNDNIINLNNFLILINNDNSLDKNVIISYEDNTRYFLKIISIVSFFILILFIIFYRQVKSYI